MPRQKKVKATKTPTNKRTFKFVIQNISNEYQFQCFLINEENKEETQIELNQNEKQQENQSLTFTLENNNIKFFEDLINNTEEYKLYTIQLQKEEYQVVAEILLALILDDFIHKAKKDFIIEKTLVEFQNENKMLKERINVALDAAGLNGIEIGEEITYNYEEQGNILNKLLEKKEAIEKRKKLIKQVNEHATEMNIKEIEMNESQMLTSQDFNEELMNKYTFKQRIEMNLSKLDNYCIFIASRYFDSLDDHINLVKVSKRMRGNMEKFHYNPVSVNKKTVSFFPNTESLHCYEPEDEYLEYGRIERYVEWNKVSLSSREKLKEQNKNKEIEFKTLIFTKKDSKKFKENIKTNNNNNNFGYYYNNYEYYYELKIPNEVKDIDFYALKFERRLRNIDLPLNATRVINGNQIFNNQPHFGIPFCLPTSIEMINGKKVQPLRKLEIPSFVTSLQKNFFVSKGIWKNDFLQWLNELHIYSQNDDFIDYSFLKDLRISNITIPLNETRVVYGNQIFNNQPHFSVSIELPPSICIINGERVKKCLEIPSFVTSLNRKHFTIELGRWHQIKWSWLCEIEELKIHSQNDENFDYSFIHRMNRLTSLEIPMNETRVVYGNQIFNNQPHFGLSIQMPRCSIKVINGKNVERLTKLEIPSFVTSIEKKMFRVEKNDEGYRKDCWHDSIRELHINSQDDSKIDYSFLKDLDYLTKITIPLNETRVVYDNKIFDNTNQFKVSIKLPPSIKVINGKNVQHVTKLEIPSSVTSIGKNCFKSLIKPKGNIFFHWQSSWNWYNWFDSIEELHIHSQNYANINYSFIEKLHKLTKLTIPLNETRVVNGNQIYNNNECFDISIQLPPSIKIINDQEVNSTFTFPSFIKSINKKCFSYWRDNLCNLKISEEFDQTVNLPFLEKLIHLTNITIPLNETRIVCGSKIFNNTNQFKMSIQLPESIQVINGKNVQQLTKLEISSSVTSIDEKCFEKSKNQRSNNNWFDSIQELHVYSKNDEKIDYSFINKLKKLTKLTIPLNNNKVVIENKIFSIPHFEEKVKLQSTIKTINGNEINKETSLTIPTSVTSLEENCFIHFCKKQSESYYSNFTMGWGSFGYNNYNNNFNSTNVGGIPKTNEHVLKELIIPSTVEIIPSYCLYQLTSLTKIEIPLNETRIIHGNQIYNYQPQFEISVELPTSIKLINGEEISKITSFTIPSFVTSIGDDCFENCIDLKEVTIPENLKDCMFNWLNNSHAISTLIVPESYTHIPNMFFQNIHKNIHLIISSEYTIEGDRLFRNKNNCLESVIIPSSITQINDTIIESHKQLETYTIPSNVTKLSDQCFYNCSQLTEIKGLEQIKEFGSECFINCEKLDLKQIKSNKRMTWLLDYGLNQKEIKQLEKWTGMKCGEVLMMLNSSNWKENIYNLNDTIFNKQNVLFLIETIEGEKFGYFSSVEIKKILKEKQPTNSKSFLFNLESNGRLQKPMKFEVLKPYSTGIVCCAVFKRNWGWGWYWGNDNEYIIELGDVKISKKDQSMCIQNDKHFDYHGIENALCGKVEFNEKKILVIQMK